MKTILYALVLLMLSCGFGYAQVNHQQPLFHQVTGTVEFDGALPSVPSDAPVFTVDRNVHAMLRQSVPIGGVTTLQFVLVNGQSVTLDLERFEVFTPDAQLRIMSDVGPENIARPSSLLLKGSVREYPGSHVVLAVYPTCAFGRIETGRETYHLAQLPSKHYALSNQVHPETVVCIVLPHNAVHPPEPWICSATDPVSIRRVQQPGKKTSSVQASLKQILVALEGDTPYYQDHGNSATAATEYAEAVIAAVSEIYVRELGAAIKINSWTLWTTTDPYPGTTSSSLLTQFRSYWRNNHRNVNRTVAHLFSGINNIGGVAYLDGLCNTSEGYGVSGLNSNVTYPRTTYAWDTDVAAHELGHNVGSPHTHSCTWTPAIDSCYTAEGSCFTGTKPVKGTIMSYCHLTVQGKELTFHPKCIELMSDFIASAECMPQSEVPVANAGEDMVLCGAQEIQLQGSVSGGVEPYRVRWSPGQDMDDSTSLTPTLTVSTTTSFILTVFDDQNYISVDTVHVVVNPDVQATMPAEYNVCKGNSVTIVATITGGTNPKTYTWNVNGVNVPSTTNVYTFTPDVNSEVYLDVVDAKGCYAQAMTNVYVNPLPRVQIAGPVDSVCATQITRLKPTVTGGTPPFTYRWRNVGGVLPESSDSLIVSPDSTETYWITVTDSKGCADSASATVKVYNLRFSATPATLDIGSLGACQTVADSWVTITNTGSLPVVIEAITAKTVTATSKDFPVTVMPGTNHLLPIQISMPLVSPISDTLVIQEKVCGVTQKVALVGRRGEFTVSQNVISQPGINVVSCTSVSNTTVLITVDNQTGKALSILRAKSRIPGAFVQVPGAPVIVGAGQKSDVTLILRTSIPEGTLTDTLDIVFQAENCTSEIACLITLNGISTTMTMPDTLRFTDPVTPGLDDQTKDVQIVPDLGSISQAVVQNVTVTGPFSSSLTAGTPLVHADPLDVTITFHPSRMTGDGLAKGALRYSVDSCTDAYVMELEGIRGTVSVHEYTNTKVAIWYSGGSVYCSEPTMLITVYDLRGMQVAHGSCGASGLKVEHCAAGVYGVVASDREGSNYVHTILIQ